MPLLYGWTNQMVLEFLDIYEAEPVVYDPRHPGHKSQKNIKEGWLRIKNAFSVDMPLLEIKKKKASLMAAFRSHVRKSKACTLTGQIYQTTWFAYNRMMKIFGPIYECEQEQHYTENSIIPDFSENDPDDKYSMKEEQGSISCHDIVEIQISSPRSSNSWPDLTKEKWTPGDRHAEKSVDSVIENNENSAVNEDDEECDLYAKLIAKKLKRVPVDEREELFYEIDGLFLNAKRRRLLKEKGASSTSQLSS